MYSYLSMEMITFEPTTDPNYSKVVLDPTVKGCEYLMENKEYYLKEMPLIGFGEDATDGIIRLELKSVISDDKPYWLIDYICNSEEIELWGLKKHYSEEKILDICNMIMRYSIESLFDEELQKKHGKEGCVYVLVAYLDDKEPNLKVLECGELPNGIEASYLVCDPEKIIEELFGKNLSLVKKSRLLEEANKMLTTQGFETKPKPVSEKQKKKQAARLERHQKSKNQQKK